MIYKPNGIYKEYLKTILIDSLKINEFKIRRHNNNYTLSVSLTTETKSVYELEIHHYNKPLSNKSHYEAVLKGYTKETEEDVIFSKFFRPDSSLKKTEISTVVLDFGAKETLEGSEKFFTSTFKLCDDFVNSFDLKRDYFYTILFKELNKGLTLGAINDVYRTYGDIYINMTENERADFVGCIEVQLGEVSFDSFELLKLNYKK